MDHLEVEQAFLLGYALGAAVSLVLASTDPSRFRVVVLGGIGDDSVSGRGKGREAIIKGTARSEFDWRSACKDLPRLC